MKVVQINHTCGVGSTGKICVGISELLTNQTIENYILYSNKTNGYELGIPCSNDTYIKIQALKSKLLGNYGFNSKRATKKIIKELDRIDPDIVHLHNIHGHDCDLEDLFKYFKKKKTKLCWTFHDCWAFTAYCPHFTMMKCEKWKHGCNTCVQKKFYTWLFDRSKTMYERKKEVFSDLDLTIITPSQWLANLIKESFLAQYPVKVINNGIDLNIFQPTISEFKERYGIEKEKKIILGVAYDWGERKGLDVFIELSKRLDSSKYQIVLVGTNSRIEQQLPQNILSIQRTNNQKELAKIYTVSDVFVNPTREEVLGMVNLESLACGTPVITFKTGGSPECIGETSGKIVEVNDIMTLEKNIIDICENQSFTAEQCREQARSFEQKEKYMEYINLYETIEFGRN